MRRTVAGILCMMALPVGAAGQGKPDGPKDINVDFSVGWGECYRPMEWTPLRVGITTPFKKPLDCIIQISATQDDLNNLVISRREVIEPDRPKEIPLVTKFAFAVDQCTVTIADTKSNYFWSRKYQLWDRRNDQRMLTAVADKDVLIGVSGKQGFGLMQLPTATAGKRDGERGTVYARYVFQRLLPADWSAYVSLDLLVLYDPDWSELKGYPAQAIAQWVHNGGRLLVILGSRPLPPDHPVARLLPLEIAPPTEVRIPARELTAWGCRNWQTDKVACWTLGVAEQARGWQTQAHEGGQVVGAHGPVGFGRVGVCAFDPATIGGRQDRSLANFWVPLMKPLLGRRTFVAASHSEGSDSHWHYRLGPAGAATNAVLEHLYSVEELRPIHIGWVVLVLAVLAVLIGPVDYLVLKKLGQLPLTWVTASLCIALFSVGAYYGVEYLRGGVLQARVVSVLDGVSGSPSGWSTRYLGIFAPHSDEYRLKGIDTSQWWSGMAPTQGDDLWGYRERTGTRNIYCAQHIDGGNVPTSVPINIWAMQCLQAEAPLPKHPLEADARYDDDRREWVVTVRNLAEAPIADGYLLLSGPRSVPLGPVPAGAAREFRGRAGDFRAWDSYVERVRQDPGEAGRQASRYVAYTAFGAQGTSRRTEAISDYLKDGAAVVCAEFDLAAVPFAIDGRKCTFQHKQLARLVVFPQGKD